MSKYGTIKIADYRNAEVTNIRDWEHLPIGNAFYTNDKMNSFMYYPSTTPPNMNESVFFSRANLICLKSSSLNCGNINDIYRSVVLPKRDHGICCDVYTITGIKVPAMIRYEPNADDILGGLKDDMFDKLINKIYEELPSASDIFELVLEEINAYNQKIKQGDPNLK
jgi:hypothetical protein